MMSAAPPPGAAPTTDIDLHAYVDALKGSASHTLTAEVRQRLGEPRGYGAVRIEPDVPARTIWFYEYEHSAGSRVNIQFLLVYFYQDLYEGHNWFSSGSLFQQK